VRENEELATQLKEEKSKSKSGKVSEIESVCTREFEPESEARERLQYTHKQILKHTLYA
jgi:hypothetical protein